MNLISQIVFFKEANLSIKKAVAQIEANVKQDQQYHDEFISQLNSNIEGIKNKISNVNEDTVKDIPIVASLLRVIEKEKTAITDVENQIEKVKQFVFLKKEEINVAVNKVLDDLKKEFDTENKKISENHTKTKTLQKQILENAFMEFQTEKQKIMKEYEMKQDNFLSEMKSLNAQKRKLTQQMAKKKAKLEEFNED